MENQKNLILAVVFSILVLLIFDFFFPQRQVDNLPTEQLNKITNEERIEPEISGSVPKIKASKIYHFAANADVRGGVLDHKIDLNENLLVSKNCCDYAVKNKISNFG